MEDKNMLIAKIQNKLIKEYGESITQDLDLYDFEGRVDSTISPEENYTIINEDFKVMYDKKLSEKKDNEMEEEAQQVYREEAHTNEGLFKQQANYLILSKKGAGKTCLGFKLMESISTMQNKKSYVYRFPKPELLKDIPFKVRNINNFDALFQLTNAVVFVDEAHIQFSSMEKKVNEQLRNLLSISRQNNTDFILACHNSYFINRCLFSFIDIKIVKEVNPNHWDLERNYMRRMYEDVHVYGKESFFIDSDFERGDKTFKKPEWFTDGLSNAYKSEKRQEDFFAPYCPLVHTSAKR